MFALQKNIYITEKKITLVRRCSCQKMKKIKIKKNLQELLIFLTDLISFETN